MASSSRTVLPHMASSSSTVPRQMVRINNGTKGTKIDLLTNHFKVNFTNVTSQDHFFQYSVAIKYEDKTPVEGKRLCRKILAKLQEAYKNELGSKHFAYDGEKTLYTVVSLPKHELDFSVVLEDMSSSSSKSQASTSDARPPPPQSKTFNVEIKLAAQISSQVIKDAFQGEEPNDLQNAVRAMDVMLRQNAATRGCLLVRQSFFQNEPRYLSNHFGGVQPCRGFYSSFRPTQEGLSLNIDVSTTFLVRPGPVLNFLTANQEKDVSNINWNKAERTLKNLRVKLSHSNRECKITGLTKRSCKNQTFTRKIKQANGEDKYVEVTVHKYFTETLKIKKRFSPDLPCIDVGTLKRPAYIPIELCDLVPLQRYTKALTSSQRSKMVTASVQHPQQKIDMLKDAYTKYNNDRMLQECGVSIGSNFTKVKGRVLAAPKLRVGNGVEFQPCNGRWNFNDKKLVEAATVTRWAIVNFSARCDTDSLMSDLIRCGRTKGIIVEPPYKIVFQENPRYKDEPANTRVDKMFEQMQSKLGEKKPIFLLCILAEKKNSLVYGPWKKKNLVEHGFVTQCIAPTKINDQYITNVLLKINAKLGGLNSVLAMERSPTMMPLVTQVPTFIIGMDVSHGSPGSDGPSIAAVVGSRQWPLISKYRACVRTQPRRTEMIENLFKPVTYEDGTKVDEGIFWELLSDFYHGPKDKKTKPEHIIIFRDGVSESQFTQVLDIELDQIEQACKFFKDMINDEKWNPKFTVIISVKRHHTRFFKGRDNVSPGTIVDSSICSPYINNFYLCAHTGNGTLRPIHYYLLRNDIGFTTDELQELVHSLSYVYQRSTSAISQVAPVMYAHLAAAQMATVMKFDDNSETSSNHGESTTSGEVPVPPMPKLHPNVASSMFFC